MPRCCESLSSAPRLSIILTSILAMALPFRFPFFGGGAGMGVIVTLAIAWRALGGMSRPGRSWGGFLVKSMMVPMSACAILVHSSRMRMYLGRLRAR